MASNQSAPKKVQVNEKNQVNLSEQILTQMIQIELKWAKGNLSEPKCAQVNPSSPKQALTNYIVPNYNKVKSSKLADNFKWSI